MRRIIGAIFFAALIIPNTTFGTLHAQVRGGGFRGSGVTGGRGMGMNTTRGMGMNRGFVGTMPSPVTPMTSPVAPPAFVGRPSVGFNGHRGFGSSGAFGFQRPFDRFNRPFVSQPFVGYYDPFLWGAPYYSAPYVDPNYIDPNYITPTYAPQVDQTNADLEYQVQALSQEVERLRQEQEQQQQQPVIVLPQPTQAAPPAPDVPPTPTTLVFRNGRKASIQNFAIVGQTLWVLDDRTTSKIALSELNLPATEAENRSKGVRFPLP